MRVLLTMLAAILLAGCSGSCSDGGQTPGKAEAPTPPPDQSTVYVIHEGQRFECPVPHASWDAAKGELTIRVTQHRRAGLGEPPTVRMVLKIKDMKAPLGTGNLERVRLSFEHMPNTGTATMTGGNTLEAVKSIQGKLGVGEQIHMEIEFGLNDADNQTDMRGKLVATIQ